MTWSMSDVGSRCGLRYEALAARVDAPLSSIRPLEHIRSDALRGINSQKLNRIKIASGLYHLLQPATEKQQAQDHKPALKSRGTVS